MTETNKRREMRIVGYDRRLLIAQMQLLAAVLLLPAMALSAGWAAALLGVLFFALILAVFLQAWNLRKTGVCVIVEDVPGDAESGPAVEPAEEISAAPEEESPEPPADAEPAEPQPHWTDTAYPDPDVELGLIESPAAQTDADESPAAGGEPTEPGRI
ncbi:MAG: hypothetical protein JW849_09545 [Phycisphaerae bacterium]|nr:hypothetical protein [Phycisphaerae bacterium]